MVGGILMYFVKLVLTLGFELVVIVLIGAWDIVVTLKFCVILFLVKYDIALDQSGGGLIK